MLLILSFFYGGKSLTDMQLRSQLQSDITRKFRDVSSGVDAPRCPFTDVSRRDCNALSSGRAGASNVPLRWRSPSSCTNQPFFLRRCRHEPSVGDNLQAWPLPPQASSQRLVASAQTRLPA
nr:hypothetical protein CFP56_52203 [Quercus suber]